MKKIILLIAITISVYSLVSDTHALTYGGSSTYSLPNMVFNIGGTNWLISPKNYSTQGSMWTDIPAGTYGSTTRGLSCFDYPENYDNNGYILSAGWSQNYNFRGISYSLQDNGSGVAIVDTYVNIGANSSLFSDEIIDDRDAVLVVLPYNVNSGIGRDAMVVCLEPIFSHNLTNTITTYNGTNVYIYGYTPGTMFYQFIDRNWSISNPSTYQVYNSSIMGYFNGAVGPVLRSYEGDPLPDSSLTGTVRNYFLQKSGLGTANPTQSGHVIDAFAVNQDYFDVSQFSVNPTLPQWFGMTNTGVFIPPDTGTGGTGTGNTVDYFEDCDSFLDVGCYIVGAYNALIGWISSLFPDIEFQGSWSACPIEEGMQTPIGYNGGNEYIQAIADIFAIVSPVPPPEGTEVCLLGGGDIWDELTAMREPYGATNGIAPIRYEWFWKNEHHVNGTTMNVFDILILFVVAMGIYYTLHHKKTEVGSSD